MRERGGRGGRRAGGREGIPIINRHLYGHALARRPLRPFRMLGKSPMLTISIPEVRLVGEVTTRSKIRGPRDFHEVISDCARTSRTLISAQMCRQNATPTFASGEQRPRIFPDIAQRPLRSPSVPREVRPQECKPLSSPTNSPVQRAAIRRRPHLRPRITRSQSRTRSEAP